MLTAETKHEETPSTVRDPDFYNDSHDCVIKVKNVLFKVSRSFLARDGSTFEDIFGPPNHSGKKKSAAVESDPLPLDDEVEDFRALCWALSALPSDITAQSTQDADVRRLLSVAVMAIKYNFESLGRWSISVVNYHCDTSNFISGCSDGDLERLAHIAHHENIASSSDSPLLRTLQAKWLKMLKDNEQLSVNHALDVGEKYKWDTFRGILYHREALRLCSTPPQGNRGVVSPPQALDHTHDRRVLVGFTSLSLSWDRFAAQKVPFVQLCGNQDYHRTHCTYYYNLMWAELVLSAVINQNAVNLPARITHMRRTVPSNQSYKSIASPCQQQVLDGLTDAYEEFILNLPYHFLNDET